jgi:hypothetical protein
MTMSNEPNQPLRVGKGMTSVEGWGICISRNDNGRPAALVFESRELACKMAAAEDLLVALKDMVAQASGREKSCGHSFYCVCPFDKATAAIQKAESK